jgi:hypothetical protein
MTRNPFIEPVGKPIVYVREVAPEELPDELRVAQAKLFALHDAEGNRLAIAPDRRLAFALARKNDLKPLSVH